MAVAQPCAARSGPLSRPARMRTASLCRALAQAACSPGRAAHATTGADHACSQSCHRADRRRIQQDVPALMRTGIIPCAGSMRPRMLRWSLVEGHKAPVRLPDMPAEHACPFMDHRRDVREAAPGSCGAVQGMGAINFNRHARPPRWWVVTDGRRAAAISA